MQESGRRTAPDTLTVVGIAGRAHRGRDAGFGKALGVADRGVLAATVRVMHEVGQQVAALPERHLQGLQRHLGAQ